MYFNKEIILQILGSKKFECKDSSKIPTQKQLKSTRKKVALLLNIIQQEGTQAVNPLLWIDKIRVNEKYIFFIASSPYLKHSMFLMIPFETILGVVFQRQ